MQQPSGNPMNILYTTLFGIVSIISTMMAFIFRSYMSRLEALEVKMENTITKQEVRQLLDDKLAPMREDIKEIKDSLTTFLEIVIDLKRNDISRG
jgi:hypothetical protein